MNVRSILKWIDEEPPLGTESARTWYEGCFWMFAAAGLMGVAGVVIGAAANQHSITTDITHHPDEWICSPSQESSHGVCRPSVPHDQHGG